AHVTYARSEASRPRRPEQIPVLLHRGAAAGGIDDHMVKRAVRRERGDRRGRPRDGGLLLAAVQLERAATVGERWREHLEPLCGQDRDRGPMHRWVEHPLDA